MTKAVEVITSVQRRRRWSAEEKRRIVAAAIEPGALGQDLRTFTCPECKRVQRHVIESSVTEAWIAPKQTSPRQFR